MKNFSIAEVFNTRSSIPLCYVDRDEDAMFRRAILMNRHILISGPSKQGKTTMIRHALESKNKKAIWISCLMDFDLPRIFERITANVDGSLNDSVSSNKQTGVSGGINSPIKLEAGKNTQTISHATRPKSIDTAFVISNLKSRGIDFVVLDDCHFLSDNTRSHLANSLKALVDHGVFFILCGVEKTAVSVGATLGGNNLPGRFTPIPVERSSYQHLQDVIAKGCQALNVHIDQTIRQQLIDKSMGNLGVLHELIAHFLLASEVEETSEHMKTLSSQKIFDEAVGTVTDTYRSDVDESFRNLVANKKRGKNGKTMTYWILKVLLDAGKEDLIDGVNQERLVQLVNSGKFQQPAHSIVLYLEKYFSKILIGNSEINSDLKYIRRPFLYYDKTHSKLHVDDALYRFVILNTPKDDLMKVLDDALPPIPRIKG